MERRRVRATNSELTCTYGLRVRDSRWGNAHTAYSEVQVVQRSYWESKVRNYKLGNRVELDLSRMVNGTDDRDIRHLQNSEIELSQMHQVYELLTPS